MTFVLGVANEAIVFDPARNTETPVRRGFCADNESPAFEVNRAVFAFRIIRRDFERGEQRLSGCERCRGEAVKTNAAEVLSYALDLLGGPFGEQEQGPMNPGAGSFPTIRPESAIGRHCFSSGVTRC